MTTAYGPIVTGDDVETAVRATLAAWANAYTDEVGRQKSVTLPPLRYYGTAVNLTDASNEYPAVAVLCPGLLEEPTRHGTGAVDAVWACGVGIVVAHLERDQSLRLAKLYGAAVRAALVQQGSLGGFATETTWTDEETTSIGYELDRWMASCTLMFAVRVGAVVNRFGGPVTPPVDPTAPIAQGAVASTSFTLARLT